MPAPNLDTAVAPDTKPTRWALVSVSDKTGIVALAQALIKLGFGILSTGGTAKWLAKYGVPVTEVSEYTGFPEMLDGRLKTIHPKIAGGLLARRDLPEHMAAITAAGIVLIDVAVVNLYPFVQTIAKPGCTLAEAIENIDIGGPTMVRSAAKNHGDEEHGGVTVMVDSHDYIPVLVEMCENNGAVSSKTRLALAKKAFAHTAAYDGAIDTYLAGPVTHGMQEGKDLCNGRMQSSPDWPRGDRGAPCNNLDEITCRPCVLIARYLKRMGG